MATIRYNYGAEEYGATVLSNIQEELLEIEGIRDPQNAILVLGTASEGELHKPFPMSSEFNPRKTFGKVIYNSAGWETSLVRAYDEIRLIAGDNADVRGMRIGNATKAYGTFYEVPPAGAHGSLEPEVAIIFEAAKPGKKFSYCTIDWQDNDGDNIVDGLHIKIPASISPTGNDISFSWSLAPDITGAAVLTSENSLPLLARSIRNATTTDRNSGVNINLIDYMRPVVQLVQEEEEISINPSQREYNLSYNKVWNILKAVEPKYVEDEIEGGGTLLQLNYTPIKDLVSPTIAKWWRYPKNEKILNATPDIYGTPAVVTMACGNTNLWISGSGNLVVDKIRGRRSSEENIRDIPSTDYEVDDTTGEVTFYTTAGSFFEDGFDQGDEAWATYKYRVDYVEAMKRSNLQLGNPASFFVIGSEVLFGTGQPIDLIAEYDTEIVYEVGSQVMIGKEVSNGEPDTAEGMLLGVINLPANLPDTTLKIVYEREPGFPASSGYNFTADGFAELGVQPSAMQGGNNGNEYGFVRDDDGKLKDSDAKRRYKEALIKGYQAIDNYPFKAIIPMGAYLDDYYIGYNYEDGTWGEKIPVGFHDDLSSILRRKSRLVKECVGYITTRPPRATGALSSIRPEDEWEWIDRHVRSNQNDPTRPANIINGVNDYRMVCVAGTPVGNVSSSAGNIYIMNPANIYVGAKEITPIKHSLTGRILSEGGDGASIQHLLVRMSSMDAIGAFNRARYTTFATNSSGSIYVADAPTLARRNSNLARQYVLDVVLLAVNIVRDIGDIYIGQPYRTHVMAAMKRNIGTALRRLVPDILTDFTADVTAVPDGFISGRTKVRLTLTTSVEVRKVDIDTQVVLGVG